MKRRSSLSIRKRVFVHPEASALASTTNFRYPTHFSSALWSLPNSAADHASRSCGGKNAAVCCRLALVSLPSVGGADGGGGDACLVRLRCGCSVRTMSVFRVFLFLVLAFRASKAFGGEFRIFLDGRRFVLVPTAKMLTGSGGGVPYRGSWACLLHGHELRQGHLESASALPCFVPGRWIIL